MKIYLKKQSDPFTKIPSTTFIVTDVIYYDPSSIVATGKFVGNEDKPDEKRLFPMNNIETIDYESNNTP